MKFTLTLLVLATAMVVALSAWGQQEPVAPGLNPAPANIAPTLRSACADVAASSPRHGGVKPPLQPADLKVGATTAARTGSGTAASPAKPFTQEQVSNMVRDGFGDESGAKLIEQRGIDFTPSEDFIRSLKAAGASEAFLNALRAAKPPEPPSPKMPLHQVQILALLGGGVPSHRVAMLVNERGINFEPQQDYLDEVRLGGGDHELVAALKSAKVAKPETFGPTAQPYLTEVGDHVTRGDEFVQERQFPQAEQEYRAALLLASQDADLSEGIYVTLGYTLVQQGRWDDAATAFREAIRLNPNNGLAHNYLAEMLGKKGDWDGTITEEREALRLDPNNAEAHNDLGLARYKKGDRLGALEEYRAASTLDPKDATYKRNYDRLLQQVNH